VELTSDSLSYVSVAIRSFVHHFHPAYGPVMNDYADKIRDVDYRSV